MQAEYNGYVFTKDPKTGYYLSTRRIGGYRRRLHRYVYECERGAIPRGCEVHHIDLNKDNNDISNLELLSREAHRAVHVEALKADPERLEAVRAALKRNAQPAATAWHKSEAAKDFHRKLGKESWEGREPITYKCSQCGKEFQSMKAYGKSNRFCSNNCKSAYRRASGKDKESRTCIICGVVFDVYRYSPTRTCSPKCRRAYAKIRKNQEN